MLFNSFLFIFIFVPVTLIAYYTLNHFGKSFLAKWALVVASFVFYGSGDYRLCFLLGASVLVNYFLQGFIVKSGKYKKLLAFTGVVLNLSPLFYYKYLNFSIRIVNQIFSREISPLNIVLPLGISFFTFQQISVIVDSAKEGSKKLSFLNYALFVSFFPQLVAGPIVLHDEMMPQFADEKNQRFNADNFYNGVIYFFIGLSKKVLLADRFAILVNEGYGDTYSLNSLSAILVIVSYTLQIYFDFSGYCDMAIGLGYMFNIKLPKNFDSPYKAKNIKEFWDRWHMTLTRFLTHYVYFPLGGSRVGKLRTCINVLIVFAVSGLWHGASMMFVFWGILHGIAMVVYRLGKTFFDKLPKLFMQLITFAFVNIAWVFFRAEYFRQALSLISHAIRGGLGGVNDSLATALYEKSIQERMLARLFSSNVVLETEKWMALIWVIFGVVICFLAPSSHDIVNNKNRKFGVDLLIALLGAWCIVQFSQFSSFIYFNF